MNEQHVRQLLDAFALAWGDCDVDGVMDLMTDDCVYHSSAGPQPGAVFRGASEMRDGITEMFVDYADSTSTVSNIVVTGSFAFWEWTFAWPRDETRQDEKGCDFFQVSEGKISRKDAFRKTYG